MNTYNPGTPSQNCSAIQHKLQLIKIGDSTGFLLPPEVATALNVKAGDTVTPSVNGDGCYLTARKQEIEVPDCSHD